MEPTIQKLIHTFESLADLGEEVANSGDFDEMVRTSLHLLLGTLAIRRGSVVECDPVGGGLSCRAVWGLGENFTAPLKLAERDKDLFLSEPAGVSLGNARIKGVFSERLEDLRRHGIEVIVPVVVRDNLTGLVLLGSKASGEPFSTDDLEIIRAMVRHIGVGIHTHRLLAQLEQRAEENRRIYEELRAIYRDTVRAFAAAIDIKDKYTQGHSERVGKYSEIIAREMGWNEDEVEGIAIAGYLHDVGKLVVERDIINAPYRIDAKASSELNRHPIAGYEILSPIRHPYADIPLTARHHHERMDGRGYPDGLIGEQIPLGARIVALADSFDAMTTDRPYRRRRSFEDVVEDLRRNTGKQFDGAVVLAFCQALLKELEGETKERRIMKLLGKNYFESEQIAPLLKQLITELNSQPESAAAARG
ncbi:MAG TPA: HD domain-containing phosphohydrolase [Pyrinomonadaceae bacterium]|nr:HD domain-containing phosphohydrolase [Pyrinomonadaceae bacterium]